MTTELRRLAEAASKIDWLDDCDIDLIKPGYDSAEIKVLREYLREACRPPAVLTLLKENLELSRLLGMGGEREAALMAEVLRLQNLCLNIGGERDEAREAVKWLAGALSYIAAWKWSNEMDPVGLARISIADPVVMRIVKG
jgi:hypothetical protein